MPTKTAERKDTSLIEQTTASPSPLDQILTDRDDIFFWEPRQCAEFALQAIHSAASGHVQACEPYARLCQARGFTPDQIQDTRDLKRVPLVPSSAFKHQALLSVPPESIVKNCLSSGTQGTVSTVPRDDLTLQRFFGSARHLAALLIGLPERGTVFNLGPDSDEAGDLWFAYVMGILELLYPARNYLSGDTFAARQLIDDLASLDEGMTPILVGPPALFAVLAEEAQDSGVPLRLAEAEGFAVTAGGWKKYDGISIQPQVLASRLTTALGLAGPHRVRDAFNMVELNTVLFECEHHRKHVPPWLHVSARDPGSLDILPPGATGVLAWLDPTATSYPAFLLSDDFGLIDTTACACGRLGASVTITRRVRRVESRGCALKIDRTTQTVETRKEALL
jgi:long-chain-fatty-acid---luciferin-component ligase